MIIVPFNFNTRCISKSERRLLRKNWDAFVDTMTSAILSFINNRSAAKFFQANFARRRRENALVFFDVQQTSFEQLQAFLSKAQHRLDV